jgi:hypothetical protein
MCGVSPITHWDTCLRAHPTITLRASGRESDPEIRSALTRGTNRPMYSTRVSRTQRTTRCLALEWAHSPPGRKMASPASAVRTALHQACLLHLELRLALAQPLGLLQDLGPDLLASRQRTEVTAPQDLRPALAAELRMGHMGTAVDQQMA